METITKYVDVNVPVRTVYNQWTQFEDFPRFMDGIDEVTQLDDTRLHWKANIGGKKVEWDAKISEQVPDKRIVWLGEHGPVQSGMVSFTPVGTGATRVTLRVDYEPEGVMEEVGDKLGLVSRKVEADLGRFKNFIEARGTATGAWRGTV
ncbi:MAG TPA: SRPBCC family protein [Candidatus Binatia bacterium]|jgi:uncharacterized membrane protein